MTYLTLRNGLQLPQIGLGTWQITDRELMCSVIAESFELGYRLIDTAAAYSNEIAVAKAVAACGIPRGELILSDKVWNTSRGYDAVQEACRRSLKKLKTDYLDIYLIHWPASPRLHPDWRELNAETWRGMEQLYKDGLVRTIGVCNFKEHHLEELKKTAEIMPFIDQFELHPGLPQKELLKYCYENGICVEASSPLGSGQVLANDTIAGIAAAYGKTPAQICLKWVLQNGAAAIPKSTKKARLAENMDVFDFSLAPEEMDAISSMPYCGGIGIDPDEVTEFG